MSFTLVLVCEDERGQVTDPQELVTAIREYGMSWPWHNERLDTIRCVTTGTRNDIRKGGHVEQRIGQWDAFIDPKTEFAAAAQAVRDAHWQIARVRRFVHNGQINGGSPLSAKLSGLELRSINLAIELERLEKQCG